jgi:hypothetical protein
MTSETRTSEEIERDIAEERAQMNDTIGDLQKKLSVDAILSDLGRMFRGQGGNLGRTITETAGRNPAAVVLVGVGLAWLVLGKDQKSTGIAESQHKSPPSGRHSDAVTSGFRPAPAGSAARADGGAFNSDSYWYGDGQMSSDYRQNGQHAKGQGGKTSGNGNSDTSATGTIRNAANVVGEAVSGERDRIGDAASDFMERLTHGLDGLSEDGRSRIVSARRAAHDARQSSADLMARGSRAATGLFEAQPLILGALAMALGSAIGSVLPQSRLEDDALGDSSDRLFANAQALYNAERAKAAAALRIAATDAKNEIREIGADLADLLPDGKSVEEMIVDRVADATTRVVQGATGDDMEPERDHRPI